MFNRAIKTALMAGVISKVKPKQATAKTQTSPQKKKKKTMQTSGAMQMKRGGKGRRSLIVT